MYPCSSLHSTINFLRTVSPVVANRAKSHDLQTLLQFPLLTLPFFSFFPCLCKRNGIKCKVFPLPVHLSCTRSFWLLQGLARWRRQPYREKRLKVPEGLLEKEVVLGKRHFTREGERETRRVRPGASFCPAKIWDHGDSFSFNH